MFPRCSHLTRGLSTRAAKWTNFGFALDIDGLLLRGKTPIPGAAEALHLLHKHNVPYVSWARANTPKPFVRHQAHRPSTGGWTLMPPSTSRSLLMTSIAGGSLCVGGAVRCSQMHTTRRALLIPISHPAPPSQLRPLDQRRRGPGARKSRGGNVCPGNHHP
jgi:hypothetical protein